MIQWKESYKLGIDVIDAQHKRLFDLAEEAEGMLELPEHLDKFDEIVALVGELRDYVKYHFKEEEKILFKIQYKQFFNHKIEHHDFIEYIYELDLDEMDLNQNEKVLGLLRNLNDWLVDHVLVKDMEWAQLYKAKAL